MALTQKNFRLRNDNGSETAATWIAATDTNITLARNQLGSLIRLRLNISTDAGTVPTLTVQLMYSKNGGAWTTTSGSTAVVVPTASAFVANSALTTQQISANAGANWRQGEFDSNNGAASTFYNTNAVAGDESEPEFCFWLRSADLAVGDTVDLRVESGTGTVSTWTATPRITISAPTGVTQGATLSGVTFPLRHAGMGPYRSSAGNEYFFGRDSVNTGTIEPHKATDPMASFTAQTAKTMSSGTTTAIEAAACFPVGDVIHIAAQIATGAVYYNSYNMSTDAWTLTTSETAVAAATFAPSAGYSFVSLVVRSSGNVVIAHCAGLTAMASGFHMVRYRERTGVNTYGTATNVDGGGSVDWGYGFAVLGASDRVHFLFARLTATQVVHQRTLSAANALETLGAGVGTGLSAAQTWPISYVDSGTTRVRALAAYSATENLVSFDSADAPTLSVAAGGISDRGPRNTSQQYIHALANDGTTLHMLYADSTDSDLYHDTSTGGGGAWTTDVEEIDAATINRISTNVYDRSGKKLAMVLDDAGAIKYAEITLPASLIYPTNDVLTQLRRR